ncbi:MAG: ABC transporter permease [Pseudomonadota bacterium]
MALILREMSTRYGRSPGGYIWAILEPLGAILLLGIGFSLVIRNPPLGNNFLLFYATGFLAFNLYQNLSTLIARSINFSRALLFYPAVSWVDAILARFLLNSLTGVLITYILLTGILLTINTRTVLDIWPVIQAMALAMLLGLGVGTLNCALIGLIQVWDQVWSIATRPLFLASGIIFLYEDLPQTAQSILYYNPLMHITGLMRTGFYPMYNPQYIDIPFVILASLVPLFLGLVLLGRFHRYILNF